MMVLSYIDYTGMRRWPGYGIQAFEFRTGYINQENNVGNRVYNYIKLINCLIQVKINFLERHIDRYRIRVILCPGYDVKLQPGRGGEAVRGVSKSQLTSTKSAQMAGNIHSVTGGLVGAIKPS